MSTKKLWRIAKKVLYWYLHRSARRLVFGALMTIAGAFLAPAIFPTLIVYFVNDFNAEQSETTLNIMLFIGVFFAVLAIIELVWLGPRLEKIANKHRRMLDAFKQYLSYCSKNQFIHEMNLIQSRLYVLDAQFNLCDGWFRIGNTVDGIFEKKEHQDKVLKFHRELYGFLEFCGYCLLDYKNNGCNSIIRDNEFQQNAAKLHQLTENLKIELKELHDLYDELDNKVLLCF